ncbi:hypothetical protein EOD39_16902 [Acipenser ruthenus]|uniref:AIG1-type G domain-containing protein n=1 Tax=Acipenser ruthenus TaxID=7906 RepID=A0A444V4S9_ACIRT|nr:hypothetical protein EOD39_16902 [Acipenser ruthenus]
MILFTGGDCLQGRTIEQYTEEAGEELQQLVEKCGNRYHVLNNKDMSDRTQITQLLDKIDNMVLKSGSCCSTEELLESKHKEKVSRREENNYEEEMKRGDEGMTQKKGHEESKLPERPNNNLMGRPYLLAVQEELGGAEEWMGVEPERWLAKRGGVRGREEEDEVADFGHKWVEWPVEHGVH